MKLDTDKIYCFNWDIKSVYLDEDLPYLNLIFGFCEQFHRDKREMFTLPLKSGLKRGLTAETHICLFIV